MASKKVGQVSEPQKEENAGNPEDVSAPKNGKKGPEVELRGEDSVPYRSKQANKGQERSTAVVLNEDPVSVPPEQLKKVELTAELRSVDPVSPRSKQHEKGQNEKTPELRSEDPVSYLPKQNEKGQGMITSTALRSEDSVGERHQKTKKGQDEKTPLVRSEDSVRERHQKAEKGQEGPAPVLPSKDHLPKAVDATLPTFTIVYDIGDNE
nr:hypothetical protein CFP56_28254 [Quercus suber]